jgi:hypothetical protein
MIEQKESVPLPIVPILIVAIVVAGVGWGIQRVVDLSGGKVAKAERHQEQLIRECVDPQADAARLQGMLRAGFTEERGATPPQEGWVCLVKRPSAQPSQPVADENSF